MLCGATTQVSARLLTQRVPEQVAEQRRATLREFARQRRNVVSVRSLDLCSWTIVITNMPVEQLSVREAFALLRARWHIALLCKRCGLIDEWSSQKPWQVLCERDAKLIAMVLQHWLLLVGCWDDPSHSLRSHGSAAPWCWPL